MNENNLYKIVQLKPEEEIIEIVHQSIVPFIPKLIFFFIWFLVPFFFLFPLFRNGILGISAFFLLVSTALFFGWKSFFKWANTVLVLTDRRIIDIDQAALFDRVVSQTPYVHIDDVTYRIKGIVPTICRYGCLRIQTAGSAADIEFVHIKTPARLQDMINELRKVIEDERRTRRERKLQQIARHHSMKEIIRLERQLKHRETEHGLNELYENKGTVD